MSKSILGCAALVVCLSYSAPARGAGVLCCSHLYVWFEAGSAQECGLFAGVVESCDECVAPAGAVPVGGDLPGTPLLLSKTQTEEIWLAWTASCVTSDSDYAVYEGLLGDFTSHVPVVDSFCTTAGMLTVTIAPTGGNRYYIVVPQGDVREGSYGVDSGRVPRPQSLSACRPQLVEICP